MSNKINGFVPEFLNAIANGSSPESPAFAGLLTPDKESEYAQTFELLQQPLKRRKRGFALAVDKFAGKVDSQTLALYETAESMQKEMELGAKFYKRVYSPTALGLIDGIVTGLRFMIMTGRAPSQERGNGTGERFIYDAVCDSDLPGKEYCSESKTPTKADEDLDALFKFAGQVREVLQKVFGKNSLDGKGMRIKASGHYSNTGNKRQCEYDNAFWNGYMFVCGNASKKIFRTFILLSVVAHEMGHGFENMTLPSWNNDYYGEQGGRMEAFGDFISAVVTLVSNGWTIEHAAKKEVGGFQIGKGIFMPQIQGYCLRDPFLNSGEFEYNDPVIGKSHQTRHMKEIYHGESDRGGVHWNATIFYGMFARWCRLGGGDIVKYARVWHAGHQRMKSSMDFQQGAEAIASVCQNSEKELYPNLRAAGNEVGLILPGNPSILVP